MRTVSLIAVGVLLMPLGAGAQTPAAAPLALEVSAGLDGTYTVGHWVPVQVALRNDGERLDGSLVIEGQGARITRLLALPSSSMTRVYVQYPAQAARGPLTVTVVDSAGATRISATRDLRALDPHVPLIVVLGNRSNGMIASATIWNDRLLYVQPEQAPLRWHGYDAAAAVIVEAAVVSRLEPSQWQALRRWALIGGRLVVLGATASLATPVTGFAGVGHLISVPHAITLDAAAERAGQDLATVAAELAEITPGARPVSVATQSRSMLASVVGHIEGTPGTQPLAWMAALYVLAVLAILGRKPQIETGARGVMLRIAVTIGAFCVWSMAFGVVDADTGTIRQQATLIHVFDGSPEAFVSTVSDVVAPSRSIFSIQPGDLSGDVIPLDAGATVELVARADGSIGTAASLSLWNRALFHTDGFVPAPLAAERTEAERLRIRNDSPMVLTECREPATDRLVEVIGHNRGRGPRQPPREPAATVMRNDRTQLALLRRARLTWGNETQRSIVCVASGGFAFVSSPGLKERQDGASIVIFHVAEGAATTRRQAP